MTKACEVRCRIVNRLGLHARPAMALVDLAAKHASSVRIERADGAAPAVDGKSIMHVMLLAATQGTELVIRAEGEDAQAFCDAAKDLIGRGFDEE